MQRGRPPATVVTGRGPRRTCGGLARRPRRPAPRCAARPRRRRRGCSGSSRELVLRGHRAVRGGGGAVRQVAVDGAVKAAGVRGLPLVNTGALLFFTLSFNTSVSGI